MDQHLTGVRPVSIAEHIIEMLSGDARDETCVGAGGFEAAKPEGFHRAERARRPHAVRGRLGHAADGQSRPSGVRQMTTVFANEKVVTSAFTGSSR